MNPDTAEMPLVEGMAAPHLSTRPRAVWRPHASWTRALARLRADPARMAAVRDSWRALAWSRLLVWAAGVGTLLAYGFGPVRGAFNPPGLTRGFGPLGDLLAAPAARWDASWYLVIAHYGYRPDLGSFTASRTAFFPLYPLGIRGLSDLGLPAILAGVLISVVALALALYGIHRLATLELEGAQGDDARLDTAQGDPARAGSAGRGPASLETAPSGLARPGSAGRGPTPPHSHALDNTRLSVARLAVLLTAFAPMAFFLSAVYSESLYLALSVGLFWCARQGRWMAVGLLGALAAATRSAGLLLLVPALVLYLHGPREDRPPDAPGWLRYRPRLDALWLGLLPLGTLAYMGYLGLDGGDPLLPLHAQHLWSRDLAAPFAGVWQGLVAGFEGLRQLLSGESRHVYFAHTQGDPSIAAAHNLMLLGFLLLAVPAVVGVCRRLPAAYGAYVLVALALPLSTPVPSQPLMSLPRFLLVLFPLAIWAAAWLAPRRRLGAAVLALSALLMALFVAQFSTWHWVA